MAVGVSLCVGVTAQAQFCATASFIGDLNLDNVVNAADVTVWNGMFASSSYSGCADMNRNGVLDTQDKAFLQRAVNLSKPTNQGGMGLLGRIPAFTISEFRSGQPLASDPQQRFVEFRCPSSFPANYNFSKQFGNGYYLILVSRNNGSSIANGKIKQVINLQGASFGLLGPAANLALIKDSSFSLPVPAGSVPMNIPNGQSISFNGQHDFNTTWILIYRRPTGPGYVAKPAIPTVGQTIDANQDCKFDTSYTNSSTPPPNVFPPWDLVLDAISVDRSLLTTVPGGRGCIYAHGALFEVPPVVVSFGNEEAARHVYRNADDKNLTGIEQEVVTGIDSPGAPNPPSVLSQFCGSSLVGSCMDPHGPFCGDRECCEYVCSQIPNCCDIAWDAGCVALATLECGKCGGLGTGSCLFEHSSPYCSSQVCCDVVCASIPTCCLIEWDALCVAGAVDLCLDCGADVLANNCFQASSFPYCSDVECCTTVCIVDPACCTIRWDEACVTEAGAFCPILACGSPAAGECCLSHGTPFCSDANCCVVVCTLDPYCCEFVWDVQCVSATSQFCTSISCACGGGGAESACSLVHLDPGCSSIICCNSVCNSDPFCCGITWDASCVAAADVLCSTNPYCENVQDSCLVVHADPGCSDPACCSAVCALIPSCCQLTWDQACVDAVEDECGGCGDLFAGDCSTVHKSPYCDDAVCCNAVCLLDPFCCQSEWDSNCVDQAAAICNEREQGCGSPASRSCYVASFMQGCLEEECCQMICDGFDPFCCVVQWDAICADQAITFAQLGIGCTMPTFAAGGRGDCLVAHAQRGCSDVDCSVAVCSIDPNCCRIIWDEECAEFAEYVCISPGGCPGTESSFSIHASPGSLDPSCCNAVCFVMPECCNESWSSACVVLAHQRCKPASVWNVPCIGSCTEAHDNPGCEDVACASAVCFSDALCCTAEWDQECASLARGLCCGLPGCGNSCNESCVSPHDAPYCDSPYCCTAVCAEDPYCCTVGWDSFCVKTALARCASGCGNVESGSCFIGHLTRGCADMVCCIEICRTDPFCCDTNWDDACGSAAQAATQCESTLECGDENAMDCCVVHYESPKCRDQDCCDAVCALDTENICRDFFWDAYCVELALGSADCSCRKECGDACAGDCCLPHETASCKDLACCVAVCASDPYCCETIWDGTCAGEAMITCNLGPDAACPPLQCGDPLAGNCCLSHAGPSCRNKECCVAVCLLDPLCCESQWDGTCAKIATSQTDCPCDGPTCGAEGTGSCFQSHTTPFCEQGSCCNIICGKVQPECCSVAWDETCVKLATLFCSP